MGDKFSEFGKVKGVNLDDWPSLSKVDIGKCQAIIGNIEITTGHIRKLYIEPHDNGLKIVIHRYGKEYLTAFTESRGYCEFSIRDILLKLANRNRYRMVEAMLTSFEWLSFPLEDTVDIQFSDFIVFNLENKTYLTDVINLRLDGWTRCRRIREGEEKEASIEGHNKDILALGITEDMDKLFRNAW